MSYSQIHVSIKVSCTREKHTTDVPTSLPRRGGDCDRVVGHRVLQHYFIFKIKFSISKF